MGIPQGYRFDERSGTLQLIGNQPPAPVVDKSNTNPQMPDASWIEEQRLQRYQPPLGWLGEEPNKPPRPYIH
jgi:hypothetical protein